MGLAGKLTGKASAISIDGVDIKITKYTPKHTPTLVDVTDTGSYDPTTDNLHREQLKSKLATDVAVEGYYYKTQTNSAIVAKLYSGGGPYAVILNLDAGTIYGHGNFDIADFQAEVTAEDKVTFTCNLQSNGVFTPGS